MMMSSRLSTTIMKHTSRTSKIRCSSQLSRKTNENHHEKAEAWQIHSYGGLAELKLSNARIPIIAKPNDVLIKIHAASMNPIDLAVSRGYGATVLNAMRKIKAVKNSSSFDIEFPLTLGRDFSGIVVSKGHGVGDRLSLGEEVWGVVPIDEQGCHAKYVTLSSELVNPRPKNLSDVEAASILYAGLTAWSALWITGGLSVRNNLPMQQNRRILVLGGSGGVGSLAIQLLKAWNLQVVATCNTDAVEMVEDLGADVAVDYNEQNADTQILDEGPYDIILDCSNQGPDIIKSKGYSYGTYISLNSPMLKNIDEYGFVLGSVKNVGDLVKQNIPLTENAVSIRWGFFFPCPAGIQVFQNLVEKGKIRPVIQSVYPFSELPKAYEQVEKGHLRGKIVIDMK